MSRSIATWLLCFLLAHSSVAWAKTRRTAAHGNKPVKIKNKRGAGIKNPSKKPRGAALKRGLAPSARAAQIALDDPRVRILAKRSPARVAPEQFTRAIEEGDVRGARLALIPGIRELLQINLRTVKKPRVGATLQTVKDAKKPSLFLVPSPEAYGEDSWKWDLVFGAMIVDRAARSTKQGAERKALSQVARSTMLEVVRNQVSRGKNRGLIPHMNIGSKDAATLFGNKHRSFLTQPPVLAMGVRKLKDPRLAKDLLPAISSELDWWLRERLDQDLPFVIHPWETGEDASVDQDATLAPWIERGQRANTDSLTVHAGNKDPKTVLARKALAEALRDLGDDASSRDAAKLYMHQSPAMAAHLIRALDDGAFLAQRAGDKANAKRFRKAAKKMRSSAQSLWDERSGMFLSRNQDGAIPVLTASSFVTLAAGIPSDAQAIRMLKTLRNKNKFWSDWPIPTVALDDPNFVADQYWRGSTWINVNYLVVEGLVRYADRFARSGDYAHAREFADTARELGWKTVKLTEKGFDEYYSSVGKPDGINAPSQFTWSALSLNTLDLIERADTILAAAR